MPDLRRYIPVIVGTSAFWVLIFGAYLLMAQRRPPPQPIQIVPPPSPTAAIAEEPSTPAPLRVYVSGAVQNPGVYRLPPDSLVDDALSVAGGHRAEADLIAINLAHPLSDGEQIYVPALGETPPASISESMADSPDRLNQPTTPLDLNTATQAELETLVGVGPKTAEAIIAGRPYSTVEDLLRVKGIGDATLEKLRPFVTVK